MVLLLSIADQSWFDKNTPLCHVYLREEWLLILITFHRDKRCDYYNFVHLIYMARQRSPRYIHAGVSITGRTVIIPLSFEDHDAPRVRPASKSEIPGAEVNCS